MKLLKYSHTFISLILFLCTVSILLYQAETGRLDSVGLFLLFGLLALLTAANLSSWLTLRLIRRRGSESHQNNIPKLWSFLIFILFTALNLLLLFWLTFMIFLTFLMG